MIQEPYLQTVKGVDGPIIKFGRWVACGRLKELPIVGRESEGGKPLFLETEEGVIYQLAQNEDSYLMIMPYCRRDGKDIKPHSLNLTFTEQLLVSQKKESSEEE